MVGGMALHQILNWTTAAGLVLAVVVVAAAYLRVRQECKATLRDHVTAGPAWTAGDSWLTSITGIGGGLLATVAVAHDTEAAWLLGIYALTAALAPILYGALAPGGEQTTGTVAGYLLAALATMFAWPGAWYRRPGHRGGHLRLRCPDDPCRAGEPDDDGSRPAAEARPSPGVTAGGNRRPEIGHALVPPAPPAEPVSWARVSAAHGLVYRASRGMSACVSGLPQPVTGSQPGEAW